MFSLSLQWLVLALDTSLKAALLAIIAAAIVRLFKLRDSNVRHRVWTGVLIGMLALPIASRLIPALRLPLPLNVERLIVLRLDDVEESSEAQPGVPNIAARAVNSPPAELSPDAELAAAMRPPSDARAFRPPTFRRGNSPLESASRDIAAAVSSPQSPAALALPATQQQPETAPTAKARNRPAAALIIAGVAAIWLTGSTILLLRLIIGLVIARQLVRGSLPITDARMPSIVRECPHLRVPLTVGLFRPQILLPPVWREWPPAQQAAVLAHEQMHIDRGDCLVVVLAQLNRCLYWFHPLAWWLPEQLASLAEAACDDAVIGSTGDRTAYARHLLDVAAAASLARGRLAPVGVSMARRCQVETRIHAILDFRRPLSQRLTWSRAVLLAAAIIPLILLAAALSPSSGQQPKPPPATEAKTPQPTQADKRPPPSAQPQPARAVKDEPERDIPFTFSGTVVDDRGQAVAGATISLGYEEKMPRGEQPQRLAISDGQGHFAFSRTLSDVTTSDFPRAWAGAKLLGAKDGYGFGIGPLAYFETTGRLAKALTDRNRQIVEYEFGRVKNTLTMPLDDLPIRGRIIDSEGRPVAGAKVDVATVSSGAAGSLDVWETAVQEPKANERALQKQLKHVSHAGVSQTTGNFVGSHSLVLPTIETDGDGWFTLKGLGRERIAQLYISGPRIASMPLHARSRKGSTLEVNYYPDQPGRKLIVYHPAEFTCVAGPSLPVAGRVTDKRTGQPLAGLIVQGYKIPTDEVHGGQAATFIHTLTDAEGRYTLEGLPLGDNQFRVLPPRKSPYLASLARVNLVAGSEPPARDIAVSKGVLVRGRVTDGFSLQPLQGSVSYFAFDTNPHLKKTPGFDSPTWGYHTDAEGRFELPALPGPGLVTFSADDGVRYPRGAGADKVEGPKSVTNAVFFLTVPYRVMAQNFSLLTSINPADDAEALDLDLELSPGKSISGRVVGPTGQPHQNYYLIGDRWGGWHRQTTAEFEVKAYDAGEGRRLTAYDPTQNLVGEVELAGEAADGLEIVLRPGGTITGRVVDEAGQPIEGLSLGGSIDNFPPGMMQPSAEQKARGIHVTHIENQPTLTDKNGRFELKGIVAGRKYTGSVSGPRKSDGRMTMMYLGYIFKNATAEPGETTDLGDLRIRRESDRFDEKTEPAEKQNEPPPAEKAQAQPADAKTSSATPDQLRGRVVNSAGKPVAGAKIHLVEWQTSGPAPRPPQLLATTDASGEFSIRRPKPPGEDSGQALGWKAYYRLVVTAPGHGFVLPALDHLEEESAPSGLLGSLVRAVRGNSLPTIKLPALGKSVRGRLVNVDGQPLAGVNVKIRWCEEMRQGRLARRLPNAGADTQAVWRERVSSLLNTIEPIMLADVLPQAKTDADGYFELRDIGANLMLQLLVQGEQSESIDIVVRNEEGESVTVPPEPNFREHEVTVYPRQFVRVLGPSKPFAGRVVDFDSGQLIAGAVVRAYAVHGSNLHSSRERQEFATRTDADGQYKITGLPIGKDNRLVAFTIGDVPYVPVGCAADTTKPGEIRHDFRLKRGVWATGRVYDAETDKPLVGEIEYYWFRDRELEKQYPGLFFAMVDELYWTNANGEFKLPVLPSRGILAFRYSSQSGSYEGIDRFPRGFGSESIAGSQPIGSMRHFPTLPHYLMPGNFERVAEVNPRPGETTVRVDLPLYASQPLRIRVVDAEGNAVTDFETYGANDRWGWQAKPQSEFVVEDLLPKEQRKVLVFHRLRNLAGGAIVKHGDAQPIAIKLAPAGSVKGRLVDDAGQPVTDAELHADYDKFAKDATTAIWANHPRLNSNPTNIPVDEEGRFQMDGLIPGWTYTAEATAPRKFNGRMYSTFGIGRVLANVKVEPGETKDLGDVRAKEDKSEDKQPEKPTEKPASAAEEAFSYSGSVVDPTGKPVAGAELHLCYFTREAVSDLSPVAVTAADGTFKFSRRPQDFDQHAEDGQPWRVAQIVATADGLGFAAAFSAFFETTGRLEAELPAGWRKRIEDYRGPQTNVIKLVPDEPIKGRILTVEGRPVAGARPVIVEISIPKHGDSLDAWEKAANEPKATVSELRQFLSVSHIINGPRAAVALNITPSDSNGWLTIRGLGKDRLAGVQLIGPGIESSVFHVRTRPGQSYKLFRDRDQRMGEENYYPNTFTHVAAPSQPVMGQIIDASTGQPVAGCVVEGKPTLVTAGGMQISEIGKIQTVTGEDGRYRLEGLPQNAKHPTHLKNLLVLPPHGTSYLPSAAAVPIGLADDPVTHDVKLRHGVLLRGQVTDSRDGRPILGSIRYMAFADNPAAKDATDFVQALPNYYHYQTDSKGRYEIPVLPGKGILAFSAHDQRSYPQGVGLDEVKAASPAGNQIIGLSSLRYQNLLKVVDLAPDPKNATIDLALSSTPKITGRVLTSDGEPLKQVVSIYGATPVTWGRYNSESFEVRSYEPAEGRRLLVAEPEQNLVAIHQLKGAAADTFDVKLSPGAVIKGRLVDADGQPLENITITNPARPLSSPAMMEAPKPEPDDRATLPSILDRRKFLTDKDGRFEVRGIIPGLKYTVDAMGPGKVNNQNVITFLGRVFTDVTAQPGQTLDLGDLQIQPVPPPPAQNPSKRKAVSTTPIPSVSEGTSLRLGDGAGRRPAGEGSPLAVASAVFLPSGQPAAGAHVALIGWRSQSKPNSDDAPQAEILATAKTDEAGRVLLSLQNVSAKTHEQVHLIARAEGSAVVWQKFNLGAVRADLPLSLSAEQPVRVRFIDLDGQPAANIKLHINYVARRTANGDISDDGLNYGGDNVPLAWIVPPTTDAEGRLTIHGLASDYGIWLHVGATDRFAPQEVALNTGMPEDRGERDATYRSLIRNAKSGEEMIIPLSPARIFEGTVRYEDTLEPAAKARVSVWASQQARFGSMIDAEGYTDAAGHYRISANPGIRFGVQAYAPGGTPYLNRRTTEDIRWENGDRIKQIDVVLPRGILVRGKVVTAGKGDPVTNAAVQFIPQPTDKRPPLKGIVTGWQGMQHTAADGSFQLAVPPGPGHLLVNHDTGSYVLHEIGERVLNIGQPGGERHYAHAIHKLDLAENAKGLDLKLELQPAATVSGSVLDEQGQSVTEAVVVSRLHIWSGWLSWHGNSGQSGPVVDGRFELKGLQEGIEYPTHFLEPKRRLGATVMLKVGDNNRTIVLRPCGSAVVRFLDEQGQPLADHRPQLEFVVLRGPHRYDTPSLQSGELLAISDFAANIDRRNHGELKTDTDGKLTIPALIPGATYWLVTKNGERWQPAKEFNVQPGETLDLGDVKIEQERKPAANAKAAKSSSTTQTGSVREKNTASPAEGADQRPSGEGGRDSSVSGVVLLPSGEPAAGAQVFAVRAARAEHGGHILSAEITARATAAANGSFHISLVRQAERAIGETGIENLAHQVVATAGGYGLAWQPILTTSAGKPMTLQLVADPTPIEGRVLNLEGQPVAGARVRVIEILEPAPAALESWLTAVTSRGSSSPARMTKASSFMQAESKPAAFPGGKYLNPPMLPGLAEATSGADGRFRIAGLGPNRKVTLAVEGAAIATSWVAALTRDMSPAPMTFADPRFRPPYYHGAKFDFAAEPTQIVAGTVRDADSHQPLAGVRVIVRMLGGSTLMVDGFASAKTDAEGRYRLVGLPKPPAGELDTLFIAPDKTQPYFRTAINVPQAAALGPVNCDIDVKKAAWLAGRVTNKQTGAGVQSLVSYYPLLDNPHAPKYPNFDAGIQKIGQDDLVATDADGYFRLPALPGRGVLTATALDGRLYRIAHGAADAGFPSQSTSSERRTVYHLFSPDVTNSVRAVDIDDAATVTTTNIELMPLGHSTIRVLDDQNQPLGGAQIIGVYPVSAHNTNEQFGTAKPLDGDSADIYGLDVDGRRLILLLHRDRRIGKAIVVEGEKTTSVQLEACATISGRLVVADGKPIANQWVRARVADADSPEPKDKRAWGHNPPSVQNKLSDAGGKFTLDLIVPGIRYRIESANGIAVDVPAVTHGQSIDLGMIMPSKAKEK